MKHRSDPKRAYDVLPQPKAPYSAFHFAEEKGVLTEIPEHLLKRSAARKAALSGESAPAEASADAGTAVEPAATPDAAPAVAASAPVPEVYVEPEPEPVAPYVTQFQERKKMPFWIVPVLLFLPVWGAFYFGTLERVPQGLTGLLGEGEELYVEAGCSGCHGAEGRGGIGPAFYGGEVHETFTTIEDQMLWINQGSAIFGTGQNYASPDGRPRQVAGGMPGFGLGAPRELDVEQLLAVTLFERTQFDPEEELAFRDLELTEQMNLMIETGELEEILAADGLSIHDIIDPNTSTREEINRYLDPARRALAGEES